MDPYSEVAYRGADGKRVVAIAPETDTPQWRRARLDMYRRHNLARARALREASAREASAEPEAPKEYDESTMDFFRRCFDSVPPPPSGFLENSGRPPTLSPPLWRETLLSPAYFAPPYQLMNSSATASSADAVIEIESGVVDENSETLPQHGRFKSYLKKCLMKCLKGSVKECGKQMIGYCVECICTQICGMVLGSGTVAGVVFYILTKIFGSAGGVGLREGCN